MLYTSGTTGKPKAILHTHGGYMVGVATTLKYGLRPEGRGPLLVRRRPGLDHRPLATSSTGRCCSGATSFMYEGAPTYPYPNRWWSMVEKYGINILYTAPTAIRGLMRFGEAWPNRHDLSIAAPAGHGRRADQPGGLALVPPRDRQGALPDHGHLVADRDRHVHDHAAAGRRPQARQRHAALPRRRGRRRATRTASRSRPARKATWCSRSPGRPCCARSTRTPTATSASTGASIPGMYFTGDSARRDKDGYFWIIGRVDDVIKVSGYRLGTAEIESALVSHPAVAEAAAIGLPHEIKGNAIHTYVILQGRATSRREALAEELQRSTSATRSARSPSRRRSPSCRSCPRRAAARSCAACCARGRWGCRKGI